MAADGGCDRDVVHRMNEGMRGIELGSTEKCPEQQRIGDKGQEVSIRTSNCTNGVVRAEA